MSWRKLTYLQYAYQKVIATCRNLVFYYNEPGLSHISQILLYSAVIEEVGYNLHGYITTGLLPFEQFAEEQLWTDEPEWQTLILEKRFSLGNDKDLEIGFCIEGCT